METITHIAKNSRRELSMGEIKTDMFPEVLRMKSKEKRENTARKEANENVQGSILLPIESMGQGKNRQEK